MKIQIKLIDDNARMPTQGSENAAGFDLYAHTMRKTDKYVEFGTGIRLQVPGGYMAGIFPRSSLSDTGYVLCNSVGVIDADFRGEVRLRFARIAGRDLPLSYQIGDRIGQLVLIPIPEVMFVEVAELDYTMRGSGGFGSSGKA